jgi:hypothetical protein
MDKMNRISCESEPPSEKASNPAILSLPLFLIPADVFTIHHGDDFTPIPDRQKTYRRLFGMIFFGGFVWMVVTALQRLATRKILKNRKNSKTNSIFIFQNIDLAAKTPPKRPVFSVSTRTWRADLSSIHCGRGDYVDSWKQRFLSDFHFWGA